MSYQIESIVKYLIRQNNHDINISFPAVVIGTDNLKDGLVDVQPIVNYSNPLTEETIEYPILYNVSLIFPSSKNSTICFPVQQGDFVSLLIQSVDIKNFVNGNTEVHDPLMLSHGNLSNVVAIVGFTPYQQSAFNPNNYNNDFNNQDLNIVHNKNTDNEAIISINTDGDISLKSPTKVVVDCKEFEVNASEKIKLTSPLISENGR